MVAFLLDYIDPYFSILLRLPIAGKYKDMGVVVCGKIESGFISLVAAAKGTAGLGAVGKSEVVLMPARKEVSVLSIFADKEETEMAYTGENVEVKLKGQRHESKSSSLINIWICLMIRYDQFCEKEKNVS